MNADKRLPRALLDMSRSSSCRHDVPRKRGAKRQDHAYNAVGIDHGNQRVHGGCVF